MFVQSLGFSVSRRARRLAWAFIFSASAALAHADTRRATYGGSLLALPIGTAGIVGEFTRNAYHIEGNAKLTGLATLVANSKGAATGAGAIVGGHISPASYAVTAAGPTLTR